MPVGTFASAVHIAAGGVVFSDNFERADGDLGPDWGQFGTLDFADIESGAAVWNPSAGLVSYAAHTLEVSGDQYIEMNVTTMSADTAVEAHVRLDPDVDPGGESYSCYIDYSGAAQLWSSAGGSFTLLGDGTWTPAASLTVRVEHEVTGALRLYIDGALKASGTHTALSANTRTGFGLYALAGTPPSIRIESVEGGEL